MSQVEMTRTEFTPAGMAALLVPALSKALGHSPSRNLAELCLAQLCFETTSGHNLWNNNFGNVDISSSDQNYWMAPGQPNHIRSFDTPQAGMGEYAHQVVRRPSMVKAGNAGDALAFATAIRDTNYTPSIDPEPTARSLNKFVEQFRQQKLFAHLGSRAAVGIALLGAVAVVTVSLLLRRRRRWGLV